MNVSSSWQSGCRPRFSFVIRQPLTDEQKLSVSFACLSLRPWSTNHIHSSNKRIPSLELRVQVSEMLQEHTGWMAEEFPHTVEVSSCAGGIVSTLLIKVHSMICKFVLVCFLVLALKRSVDVRFEGIQHHRASMETDDMKVTVTFRSNHMRRYTRSKLRRMFELMDHGVSPE